MVLDIDEERRRISLGMKQCRANPWDEFAGSHNKGDKISGTIKSITDFGVFIGLDGNIDGPAEQNSLAIQNPAHARNMAHRVATEFAHAPPESRQTAGVLNKNQRVPISTVTIASRGSTSNDQASAFRAGVPRPRR
jgi:hypothetical protein